MMKSFLIAIVFLLASTSTSFAQYKERREKGQYRGDLNNNQYDPKLSTVKKYVQDLWLGLLSLNNSKKPKK